jgi:hypothetical protein
VHHAQCRVSEPAPYSPHRRCRGFDLLQLGRRRSRFAGALRCCARGTISRAAFDSILSVSRLFGSPIERLISRNAHGTLEKQRYADDSDVGRPAGSFRIGIGRGGKIESCNFRIALAPACDLVALARTENIAALAPGTSLAADHIDAVNGGDCEKAFAAVILNHDRISGAGPAWHPVFSVAPIHRQHAAGIAVDDLDISKPAGGMCINPDAQYSQANK